jgi:hypothetical protein
VRHEIWPHKAIRRPRNVPGHILRDIGLMPSEITSVVLHDGRENAGRKRA